VENVQIKAHVAIPQIGEYQRTHLLSLVESLHEPMLAFGRITLAELRKHMAALTEHLANPDTTILDRLVVQAWGQRSTHQLGDGQASVRCDE
jgi:hypothetical protein